MVHYKASPGLALSSTPFSIPYHNYHTNNALTNYLPTLSTPLDLARLFVSTGVSTAIEITFSPEVNSDISTTLNFQTETGPVSIPLVCLIKRCAPRIENPHLDVGAMVIGQIQTLPLKMKNTQALGTSFNIYPVHVSKRSYVIYVFKRLAELLFLCVVGICIIGMTIGSLL